MKAMNVIPFPTAKAASPEPLAFAIGARVDLRVGALTAGVVRPRGVTEDCYQFSNLSRLLRAARMAWRERGAYAGLVLSVDRDIQPALEASLLDEAAIEAGCTRNTFGFELDECALAETGGALAQDLRARGWNVVLRANADCPLPFGARARALYSELVVDVQDVPPFFAADNDNTPLGRRILAAKGAGLLITAACVRGVSQAKQLAIAGFHRGGGPFAEAGLR